ncbi:MAG: hypothetical protein R3C32_11085 [Chloroflexota bacterium]
MLYRLVTFDTRDRQRGGRAHGCRQVRASLQQAGVKVHALGMPRAFGDRPGSGACGPSSGSSDADVIQTRPYHADLAVVAVSTWMAGRRAIVWGIHNTFMDLAWTRAYRQYARRRWPPT